MLFNTNAMKVCGSTVFLLPSRVAYGIPSVYQGTNALEVHPYSRAAFFFFFGTMPFLAQAHSSLNAAAQSVLRLALLFSGGPLSSCSICWQFPPGCLNQSCSPCTWSVGGDQVRLWSWRTSRKENKQRIEVASQLTNGVGGNATRGGVRAIGPAVG